MRNQHLCCRRLAALALVALFLTRIPVATAQVPRGLDDVIERFELTSISLRDALRLLAEESGVNLSASEDAANKEISAFLQNLTVRQAIETIAKSNGLWYRIEEDSGVVRVMTAKEYERDLVLFRDQETRIFTLLYPNARDVAQTIRNLYGARVRLSIDDQSNYQDYDELNRRFQRFDLLENRAQSLGIFSGGNATFNGQGGSFGNTAFQRSNSPGFNQQIASQSNPDNQPDVFDPSKLGDQLTPEQLATLQRAIDASGEEGVDPALLASLRGGQASIYVTILGRHNRIAVRSSDKDAVVQIAELVAELDLPTPQVLLELRILTVELGDDFQSVFDAQYSGGNDSASFTSGDIASVGGLFDPTALIYQYVNDHFQARLQLLESRGRVTTLATPVLLVANNEVARLFVGEERPIVRNVSSQTTVNQNTAFTAATPTVEVRPVGTTLLVAPNINTDRTVTLRVLQETSTVKEDSAEIPIQVGSGGSLQPFPVDVVASRTVNATVIARDGLTVALGGLIEEGVTRNRTGIPLLMDIPWLGALFRRDTENTTRSELVILVKPLVLSTAAEGPARSRDLMDRLSIHPSAGSLGERPLDTYAPPDPPRGERARDRLRSLRLQTGTPRSGAN